MEGRREENAETWLPSANIHWLTQLASQL